MSIPTLEGKIGKTLRKANRLKATHAKLERVDELLNLLKDLLEPLTGSPEATLTEEQRQEKYALERYVELCTLHKLKFQIDAVLAGVVSAIQRLSHEPHLRNLEYIQSLVQRLHTVMALDADHLKARELFHHLKTSYPDYVQELAEEGRYLSIAPYQPPDMRIVVTFHRSDLEKHERLLAKFPLYQIPATQPSPQEQEECRMRFSLKDLDDFELFHEELRMRPSYHVSINTQPIQEQHFTDWLQCYKRFRKANNQNYCYGASPFTFNVFGCHKLYTPDIAKQLDTCWFSHGTLDPESGFFFLTDTSILQQLQQHLEHCGFCPALTQEKLLIGLNLLPHALNPECDPRWEYWPPRGNPEGVIPTGHNIAIAPPEADFSHLDPSQLIEVGPTPYVEKLLTYFETHKQDDLGTQSYQGLSTCIHCGVPYKPNTMICGKCRTDFWKYALQDLDRVLGKLRVKIPLTLPTPPQGTPAASTSATSKLSPHRVSQKGVSFEQLWSDPQVQQMLSESPSGEERPETGEPSHKMPVTPSQPQIEQKPSVDDIEQYQHSLREIAKTRSAQPTLPEPHTTPERLQFHEKIWSLISQKYRERKAIETAFSSPQSGEPPSSVEELRRAASKTEETISPGASPEKTVSDDSSENAALLNAIKGLKLRQKSELSKRGVVRVIYLATMDKDVCPLCAYLDGMVMDPDDPATDIFSPPLFPGCTCRREYVLKTEKPQNWPRVTFKFPPKDLLVYLDKESSS